MAMLDDVRQGESLRGEPTFETLKFLVFQDRATRGAHAAVKAWAALCREDWWFSNCFLVPMEFEGARGIMFMESTPESTRK